MQINTSDIKRNNHKEVAFDEKIVFKTWEFLSNHSVTGMEPFALRGRVYNQDNKLWVHFTYEGMVHFVCDRCLTPFEQTLSGEVLRECSDVDGFNVEWLVIRDSLIDLAEALTDDIMVQLPIQMLCSVTCGGLCPICGTNRNRETCSCDQVEIDPRLEGLKNFFK